MREIKFRGRRKLNGEWVYGSYIAVGNDWCQIVPIGTEYDEIDRVKTRVITETVGQYTGLHDRNGKEIYEGDVLRMFMSGKSIGADERVEFKEGSYWLRYRHMPLRNWICEPEFDGECEVIGNIYESNPLQVE